MGSNINVLNTDRNVAEATNPVTPIKEENETARSHRESNFK